MSNPIFAKNYVAGAVIEAFRIVVFDTDDATVIQASASTDALLAVSDSLGADPDERIDLIFSGIAEVEFGGTVTRGAWLTSDEDGRAIVADPDDHTGVSVIGRALVAGVVGDIGNVFLAPCTTFAADNPNIIRNGVAGGAIGASRVVKLGSADNTFVVGAADTDLLVGVVDTTGAAAQGDAIDVHIGGVCPVVYGGTVTRGAWLTSDAVGRAIVAAPEDHAGVSVIGRALVAGVVGDIGSVCLSSSSTFAAENPNIIRNGVAGGAIGASRVVKFGSADNTFVVGAAGTDLLVGVVDTTGAAAQGDAMDVHIGGVCPVVYGGSVTRGNLLTSDSAGRAIVAVPSTTTLRTIGVALVSGAVDEVGSVAISLGMVAPEPA